MELFSVFLCFFPRLFSSVILCFPFSFRSASTDTIKKKAETQKVGEKFLKIKLTAIDSPQCKCSFQNTLQLQVTGSVIKAYQLRGFRPFLKFNKNNFINNFIKQFFF